MSRTIYRVIVLFLVTTVLNASVLKREGIVNRNDVKTSISTTLQKKVERILDYQKSKLKAKEILVMVMDSKTGALISVTSSNRYDTEHIRQKDIQELTEKCSHYLYEPGSVMMPFTVAMSLNANLLQREKEKELINTDYDKFSIGGNLTISDDVRYKAQTMTDVLVNSSNIGIAKIAFDVPATIIHYALSNYGFGQKSGIDLPNDMKGRIKDEIQLKEKRHKATTAYGYGVLATPIQLLKAYSMFSNEGWMAIPHIVKNKMYMKKEVLAKPVARKVKQMLIEVVKRGTASNAQVKGLTIGGKTGTAHIAKDAKYSNDYHSSFYGFAEDHKGHRYTIGVLVIEAKAPQKYFASQSAAVVFKEIVQAMVQEKLLVPSGKHDIHVGKEDKLPSPLKNAILIKPYGIAEDPVYRIKIFT